MAKHRGLALLIGCIVLALAAVQLFVVQPDEKASRAEAWSKAHAAGPEAVVALFKTTFGGLLATRQGERVVRHLALEVVRDVTPLDRGAIRNAAYFFALDAWRAALVAGVTSSGRCEMDGFYIDAAAVESARYDMPAPGVLIMFMDDQQTGLVFLTQTEPAPLLVYAGKAPQNWATLLKDDYANRKAHLANERTGAMKRYAETFCVTAALDKIVFTLKEVVAEQQGDDIILRISGSAFNQLNRPVMVTAFEEVFRDRTGTDWPMGSVEIEPLLLNPQNPTTVTWNARLLASDVLPWLHKVRLHDASLRLRADTVVVQKETGSWRARKSSETVELCRSVAFSAVVPEPDGHWSLQGIAPVTLALRTEKTAEANKFNVFRKTLQPEQEKAEQATHKRVMDLFAAVSLSHDPASGVARLRNGLAHPVSHLEMEFDVSQQEAPAKRGYAAHNAPILPGDTADCQLNDASRERITQAEIRQMTYRGMRLDKDHITSSAGVVLPLLYQDDPVLVRLTDFN